LLEGSTVVPSRLLARLYHAFIGFIFCAPVHVAGEEEVECKCYGRKLHPVADAML